MSIPWSWTNVAPIETQMARISWARGQYIFLSQCRKQTYRNENTITFRRIPKRPYGTSLRLLIQAGQQPDIKKQITKTMHLSALLLSTLRSSCHRRHCRLRENKAQKIKT